VPRYHVVVADADAALADLRALLDSPLATRPTRERLLSRAIDVLERVAAEDVRLRAAGDALSFQYEENS
jgi:hypothetical protein